MTKVFDGGVKAVDDVSLEIADGEFMVLVGPSGCGKTTLLRMIAGLEQVSSGRVILGGEDVTDRSPRERDIAMVFQNYALYPHMTVGENLGFALKLRKISKAERARRVGDVAAEARARGAPQPQARRALSGGQRQRVAMGRAMVREPKAFLMDEPLSNLDAKLRVSMRGELARLHDRLGVTTIYVTHDQVEAMTLGQRVAVLRDGVLQQVDTPQILFRRPANLFVAAFIGSPSMNLVEADVARRRRALRAATSCRCRPDRTCPPAVLIVGIRPTDFEHTASRRIRRFHAWSCGPRSSKISAPRSHVIFPIDAPRVVAEAVHAAVEDLTDDEGSAVRRRPARRSSPRASTGTSPIRPGSAVELAVDMRRMHFFDPRPATWSASAVACRPPRRSRANAACPARCSTCRSPSFARTDRRRRRRPTSTSSGVRRSRLRERAPSSRSWSPIEPTCTAGSTRPT